MQRSASGSAPKTSALYWLSLFTLTVTLFFSHPHFAFAQYDSEDEDRNFTPPTGSDGISFMPVAMDHNLNCNSIILKGTKRYQGTVFLDNVLFPSR